MAGEDNLKRGNVAGKHAGRNGGTLVEGDWRPRKEAEEAPLREAVIADPDASLEIVTGSLTIGVKRLTERWLREGGQPSRQLVEALREFRQSLNAVVEARKNRGSAAEAEQWFAEVQDRLDSIAPYLAERARPLIEVPA